jgi:hypothetical protein
MWILVAKSILEGMFTFSQARKMVLFPAAKGNKGFFMAFPSLFNFAASINLGAYRLLVSLIEQDVSLHRIPFVPGKQRVHRSSHPSLARRVLRV